MFGKVTVIIFVCIIAPFAGVGAENGGAVDIVGRNGQFTVKHKDGSVETVDSQKLQADAKKTDAAKPVTGSGKGGSGIATGGAVQSSIPAKTGTQPTKTVGPQGAPAEKPRVDNPVQQAARTADIEQLRQMRKEGGAYFYDADKKPISNEEVDRRIASGDVAGINAVGLHLEEFATKTSTPPGANFTPPPPPDPDPPKPEKRYSSPHE